MSNSRSRNFREGNRKKQPEKFILTVVCEGEVTESDYLGYFKRLYRDKLTIKIVSGIGTDPESLVNCAVAARKGDQDPNHSVWILGDQDNSISQILRAQMDRAAANGCVYLLSVPNFEVWILLHFEVLTTFLSIDQAQSRAHTFLTNIERRENRKMLTEKHQIYLHDKFGIAQRNLKILNKDNSTKGLTFPFNPSTAVDSLISFIFSKVS